MTPKRIIIIVAAAVVIAGVAITFLFRSNNIPGPGGDTGSDSPKGPDITATLPSNLPSGDSVALQGAKGGVVVKNFYNGAAGYWSEMDAIALINSSMYAIWYYRTNSNFEIAMQKGATMQDQNNAEVELGQILGIDRNVLCDLSSYVTVVTDEVQGTREAIPLSFCQSLNMVK